MLHKLVTGVALVLAMAASARAQSTVAILDATGISILDTGTGQQRARFPLTLTPGEIPTTIAASADGSRLFVTTTLTATTGAVHVFDRVSGARIARLATSNSSIAGRVAPTTDGRHAYFVATAEASDASSVIHCDAYTVDVEAGTVAVVPGSDRAGQCGMFSLSPTADRLYVVSLRTNCFAHCPQSGSFSAYAVGASGATELWGDGVDAGGPSLALTADGRTLFVRFYWNGGILDYGVRVYDTISGAFVSHSLPAFTPPSMAVASDTRLFFLAATEFVGTQFRKRIRLIDTSTDTNLGDTILDSTTTADVPATFISDTFAARTYVLEPTRLILIDSDTVAATTVATGSGWVDGAVLKDPCATATLSQAIFTTSGGSGMLTLDAPGSCSWTIDPSTVPGLSFTTTSGNGPATLPFTLDSANAPSLDSFRADLRALTLERVQPLMHIDEPGTIAPQPFIVRGWAIERSANPADGPQPTVSVVHVWAWPVLGGAPTFLGAVPASGNRPDIAAVFGSAYTAAEFSVPVHGLPTGTYAIVAYALSARLGTFTQQTGVLVSVLPGTRIAIDGPGPTVPRTFAVSGWAADPSATTGPGVDAVHVWAFPDTGEAPIWVGAATYGGARDDIAALFGPSFRPSGYWLFGSLAPGHYTLEVFAHSTVTGEFSPTTTPLTVTADSVTEMSVEAPTSGSTISGAFGVSGWGVDRSAASGSGMDAFHVWAFPIDGSAPVWVGQASAAARPDVASLFGPQFTNAGFVLNSATLPPGTYDLAVFGHSTVTQSFSTWRLVRVTVQ